MKWPRKKFSDLYAVPSRNGLNRPSRVRGAGYKMVNMGELFANDRIGNIPMDRVPLNEKEIIDCTLVEGDLLFARQSLVLEGAGKCSYILDASETTTFESHLIRVRLDKAKAVPLFYYYLFSSPYSGISTIVQQCAQAGIRGSELGNLEVLYPEPDKQYEIAKVLGTYDDAIENNRRRMALLEKAARLLYEEWFVRLRFPGHEHTPVSHGLPKGWERKSLNAICPDLRDAANPADLEPGMPYIGLEHMPRRSITLLEWGMVEDVTSTKLRYLAGDILFGKIRPYFHKVGFALTDGVTSSDAIVLRPKDPLFYSFSLLTVSSDWFVTIVSKTAKEGSKMPRADWKLMEKHSILVPPRVILESLNETIRPILDQLRTLAFQNQKLRAARDLLLPRLMSGEIEVVD